MSLSDLVTKARALLKAAQESPLYPERKIIRGAVAGVAASLVLALGLSASPLVAALVSVLVAKVVAYLAKPRKADVRRAAKTAKE